MPNGDCCVLVSLLWALDSEPGKIRKWAVLIAPWSKWRNSTTILHHFSSRIDLDRSQELKYRWKTNFFNKKSDPGSLSSAQKKTFMVCKGFSEGMRWLRKRMDLREVVSLRSRDLEAESWINREIGSRVYSTIGIYSAIRVRLLELWCMSDDPKMSFRVKFSLTRLCLEGSYSVS